MKLTKRTVEAFRVPEGAREAFAWDDDLPGFGVRAHPSGARSFVIQYRKGRRTRRLSLGSFGRLTVEEARRKARGLLAAVETEDADPSAEKAADRKAETVEELAGRYIEQHAIPRLKPGTVADAKMAFRDYVLPRFAKMKVADVTRADVAKLHFEMKETPIRANRVLALLSKMFNLAEKWGLRPDGSNPCRHGDRYKERKRERYLDCSELERLGAVLAEVEQERIEWPTLVPFVRLLIFTGARRDEIRTLRWEHVDSEAGLLRLPDSKTGAKVIHLAAAAREVLATMPRRGGNPFVIFGAVEDRPLINVKDAWARVRKRAGLDDVRLHDLRHTFASYAVSGGFTLPMTGALLGHTQTQTTQRYAHLHRTPMAAAAESIGGALAAALNPNSRPAADVIEIHKGRRRSK